MFFTDGTPFKRQKSIKCLLFYCLFYFLFFFYSSSLFRCYFTRGKTWTLYSAYIELVCLYYKVVTSLPLNQILASMAAALCIYILCLHLLISTGAYFIAVMSVLVNECVHAHSIVGQPFFVNIAALRVDVYNVYDIQCFVVALLLSQLVSISLSSSLLFGPFHFFGWSNLLVAFSLIFWLFKYTNVCNKMMCSSDMTCLFSSIVLFFPFVRRLLFRFDRLV